MVASVTKEQKRPFSYEKLLNEADKLSRAPICYFKLCK